MFFWQRDPEAEKRAAIAEDRAAFLERELEWMREQMERSGRDKDNALKMVANFLAQNFGFMPFPEAVGLPQRQETALPDNFLEELGAPTRARDEAAEAFKLSEMKHWQDMHGDAA